MNSKQITDCNCSGEIEITAIIMACIYLIIECLCSCKRNKTIAMLTIENETLKSIILKSVDKGLVNMLKNGNNFENKDSD